MAGEMSIIFPGQCIPYSPDGCMAKLHLQDKEEGHLQHLQSLMPGHRTRPSLLGPLATAAGFSLGAAAGLLPSKLSHAITGTCCLHHTLPLRLSKQPYLCTPSAQQPLHQRG